MNHRIRLIGKGIPVSQFGDPYLWFESLSGHEAINQLFEYQLIVKTKDGYGNPAHSIQGQQGYVSKTMSEAGDSPASHLNLQKLIGTNLGIDISLADNRVFGIFPNAVSIMREDFFKVRAIITRRPNGPGPAWARC